MSTFEIAMIIISAVSFFMPVISASKYLLKGSDPLRRLLSFYFLFIALAQIHLILFYFCNLNYANDVYIFYTTPYERFYLAVQTGIFIYVFFRWKNINKIEAKIYSLIIPLFAFAIDFNFYSLIQVPTLMYIICYVVIALAAVDALGEGKIIEAKTHNDIEEIFFRKTICTITVSYAFGSFILFAFRAYVPWSDAVINSVLYVYVNYKYMKSYRIKYEH